MEGYYPHYLSASINIDGDNLVGEGRCPEPLKDCCAERDWVSGHWHY